MPLLRIIDIETTGFAPPSEIIEFGWVDVEDHGSSWVIDDPVSVMFRPLRGIPPETMAVHHITEEDFPDGAGVCSPDNLRAAVSGARPADVLVAHNCSFERAFIADATTGNLPWICTYKCALRLWPDAPAHSNQVLRYWRRVGLDRQKAMPPHRAGPDAWVTAHLLTEMLSVTTVEQLLAWTEEPKIIPKVPFGKHRGSPWADVPSDYLEWMTRQADMDTEVVWNARREIERRMGNS